MTLRLKTVASFLCLATALLFCSTMRADNVDAKTAQKVGAYFLSAQIGSKSINANELELAYQISNTENDLPAIYFFNAPNGGYVLVSGSDCVDPIVAYSTTGHISTETIPPAMLAFLSGYVDHISYAQNNAIEQNVKIADQWAQLVEQRLPYHGSSKAMITLTTSTWNQRYPYNAMCPTVNGSRCVTGCVATAMSQLMYYWKYPRVGADRSVTYEADGIGSLTVDYSTAYYNYDLMTDEASSSSSTETINAIALLNYHAGVAVRMSYSPSSSGAVTKRYLEIALKNYFKYRSETMKRLARADAPFATAGAGDSLWYDTVLQELMARRPVFYTATSPSSTGSDANHAFLCEGYNPVNGFMRINWGWGYMNSNCWCNMLLGSLNGGGYHYNTNHAAYIGIQPPQDSIESSTVSIHTVSDNPLVQPAYPNPATSHVTIPLNVERNSTLYIHDIAGNLIESRLVGPHISEITIDLANYSSGLYIYRLNGYSNKFVVR